ncbi:hypothetical protein WG66_008080 [Moniliophthora roreri]|nr:hypothetical protein WG66_008080 [Moniliophthora roreri]
MRHFYSLFFATLGLLTTFVAASPTGGPAPSTISTCTCVVGGLGDDWLNNIPAATRRRIGRRGMQNG